MGPIPRKEPILMEKRHWASQEKFRIVIEGLSGQIEISKLCAKYQIAQTQKEQHLTHENHKLRRIIGDLTVELKKTEFELEYRILLLRPTSGLRLNAVLSVLNLMPNTPTTSGVSI